MSFKTTRATSTTLTHDDQEFELPYAEPCEYSDYHVEVVGDKAVVGLLYRDQDAGHMNPFEEGTANGNLYLHKVRNCIWTDDSKVERLLGLDGYSQPEYDRYLFGSQTETLIDMAADLFYHRTLLQDFDLQAQWLEDNGWVPDEGQTFNEAFLELKDEVMANLTDLNGTFSEEVENLACDLYAEEIDRVVGPFVIPVNYFSHYETRINTDSWDGDFDNLPNGVWEADSDAMENICYDYIERNQDLGRPIRLAYSHKVLRTGSGVSGNYTYEVTRSYFQVRRKDGTYMPAKLLEYAIPAFVAEYPELIPEIKAKAEKYCEGVLKEASAWASGDVYGVVVATYNQIDTDDDGNPIWELVEDDACWGFVGEDYAQESLKDTFTSTVNQLKEKSNDEQATVD